MYINSTLLSISLYHKINTLSTINLKTTQQKKEASNADKEFILKRDESKINVTEMTFKDLYLDFYQYKSDKVKATTMRTYRERVKLLSYLDNVKLRNFNVKHYLQWRNMISNLGCSTRTKNGYHKFFKEILNYGTRWHDFNFTSVYNKMEKFTDSNGTPKEMEYYTYEEVQKYISVIDELRFLCAFEILYYCGLRKGELRGLTWDNIDFEEKTLSVKKNITNVNGGDDKNWLLTIPKTKSSVRTIPISKVLYNNLIKYKEVQKNNYGFNEKWYVIGDKEPISQNTLRNKHIHYTKESELKHIRIHDFRHSCASLLINNGASIMIVAKYLGHTKIDETLNTYSHLFKNKLDEIVNTNDNL